MTFFTYHGKTNIKLICKVNGREQKGELHTKREKESMCLYYIGMVAKKKTLITVKWNKG